MLRSVEWVYSWLFRCRCRYCGRCKVCRADLLHESPILLSHSMCKHVLKIPLRKNAKRVSTPFAIACCMIFFLPESLDSRILQSDADWMLSSSSSLPHRPLIIPAIFSGNFISSLTVFPTLWASLAATAAAFRKLSNADISFTYLNRFIQILELFKTQNIFLYIWILLSSEFCRWSSMKQR